MDLKEFKQRFEHKPVIEEPNSVSLNPLVSVCVQTYQHAKYIKECLDGILMQETTFDFEILLGEDASTDGTREICIHYAEKYPDKIRLFLHHRENNIAIEGSPTGRFIFMTNLLTAQGKYIAFCEGDDHWTDPYKLQKQVDFLETHQNVNFCFTGYSIYNSIDKTKSNQAYSQETEIVDKYKFIKHGAAIFATTSVVISKNLSNLIINFYLNVSTKLNGDFVMMLLAAEMGNIGYVNSNTCVYHVYNPGSWSSENMHFEKLYPSIRSNNIMVKYISQRTKDKMLKSSLNKLMENYFSYLSFEYLKIEKKIHKRLFFYSKHFYYLNWKYRIILLLKSLKWDIYPIHIVKKN